MTGPRPRRHGLTLAAIAAGLHLACDAVASRWGVTAPPYLLLDHAAPVFKELLLLDRTTILVTVAVAASAVNGAIAAMLAVALEDVAHRRRTLAWVLVAFWVFSGGLMILVYLSPPWIAVAGSLAAGVPRAWLVAWSLDRAMGPAMVAERADAGR